MTPVGCAVGPPITSQLNLEGIPVLGLVDTGASVTCMGFSVWWQYHTQWGPLKPFEGVIHCAHGKPLKRAGETQHLNFPYTSRALLLQAVDIPATVGRSSRKSQLYCNYRPRIAPVLIGMDVMRPLRVRIDVTNGTATPAHPDPQTIHLNAAQAQVLPSTSRALLLQAVDIPAETARLVHCHNPWPSEDAHVCVRSARAYQWIRSMGRDPQPSPRAAPPTHRANCGYLRSCSHRRCSASINRLPALSPAARPYAPVAHSTTTTEGPLPGIQRHCEPRRERPGLYAALETHHRDRRAPTLPAISPPKPHCSMRGDGTGAADAVQRRHLPLQKSLGLAGRHGQKERR